MTNPNDALDIIELLEHVLKHLPPKDLIKLQRVSEKWRNTIKTAPCIRKSLFLEPSNESHKNGIGEESGLTFQWNTICLAHVPTLTTYVPADAPFIKGLWKIDTLRLDQACEARGPWSNMYITQPPATIVDWQASYIIPAGHISMHYSAFCTTGITLKTVRWMLGLIESHLGLSPAQHWITPARFVGDGVPESEATSGVWEGSYRHQDHMTTLRSCWYDKGFL